MSDAAREELQAQDRVIDQIVELEREFYFENKGKDTERRRRLRDIIERNTPAEGAQSTAHRKMAVEAIDIDL